MCYLLLASWAAIFFTLPQYNRFRKFDPWIKWLAVAQSYLVFATFIAVYKTAPYFGSCPDYNHNARMVIFGDFSATRSGRIFGLVGTSLLIVGYTLMVLFDYWGNGSKEQKEKIQQLKELKPQGSDDVPNITVEKDPQTPSVNGAIDNALSQEPPSPATSRGRTSKRRRRHKHRGHDTTNFNIGVDGRVVLHVAVIVIVSTLAIVNTELLRNYNHPLPVDKDWGFGQVSGFLHSPASSPLTRIADSAHVPDHSSSQTHRHGFLAVRLHQETRGRARAPRAFAHTQQRLTQPLRKLYRRPPAVPTLAGLGHQRFRERTPDVWRAVGPFASRVEPARGNGGDGTRPCVDQWRSTCRRSAYRRSAQL